jgi:hypothetical protein
MEWRGTGEVEMAAYLLREMVDGAAQVTPVCRAHFEAAQRYRIARGIPLDQPLAWVPEQSDRDLSEQLRLFDVLARHVRSDAARAVVEEMRRDLRRRLN